MQAKADLPSKQADVTLSNTACAVHVLQVLLLSCYCFASCLVLPSAFFGLRMLSQPCHTAVFFLQGRSTFLLTANPSVPGKARHQAMDSPSNLLTHKVPHTFLASHTNQALCSLSTALGLRGHSMLYTLHLVSACAGSEFSTRSHKSQLLSAELRSVCSIFCACFLHHTLQYACPHL
jgi:hypothetical protein